MIQLFALAILILTSFAGYQAKAQTNFLFLTYEQYSGLTGSEQKKYIEAMQTLVVSFDDGQNFSKANLLFSHLINSVAAADDQTGSSRIRSMDNRVENAKIDHMFSIMDAMMKGARDKRTDKSNVKDVYLDTYNRLQNLSQKNLTGEQRKNFEKNVTSLKARYDSAVQFAPELKSINLNGLSSGPARSVKTETTKKSTPLQGAPVTLVSVMPPPAPEAERGKCLYAGFVITGDRCSPMVNLAPALRLFELGNADFKCKSSNEILCNPLVFGYQGDLSPYCTVRSSHASRNCQAISNNTENLARLYAAWKNPANKTIYEKFQNSLNQLCDAENKIKDVRITCKVVVAQFNEKVKKEFPASLNSRKIEASLSDKAPTNK